MKVNDKVKLINKSGVFVPLGSIGVIEQEISEKYPLHISHQIKMFEVNFDGMIQEVEEKQLELIKEDGNNENTIQLNNKL